MNALITMILGWIDSLGVGSLKGALGKSGELVQAVEGALPERWRSRKLYVAAASVALILFTQAGDSWHGIVAVLGSGSLFVVPEGLKDVLAALKAPATPATAPPAEDKP